MFIDSYTLTSDCFYKILKVSLSLGYAFKLGTKKVLKGNQKKTELNKIILVLFGSAITNKLMNPNVEKSYY